MSSETLQKLFTREQPREEMSPEKREAVKSQLLYPFLLSMARLLQEAEITPDHQVYINAAAQSLFALDRASNLPLSIVFLSKDEDDKNSSVFSFLVYERFYEQADEYSDIEFKTPIWFNVRYYPKKDQYSLNICDKRDNNNPKPDYSVLPPLTEFSFDLFHSKDRQNVIVGGRLEIFGASNELIKYSFGQPKQT